MYITKSTVFHSTETTTPNNPALNNTLNEQWLVILHVTRRPLPVGVSWLK